ncbi:MAG: hypothetical protein IJP66_09025, partial [Kiritimatiellae bacterium]|nr:hypothetical protein [Kiritimatiellia bacterium]
QRAALAAERGPGADGAILPPQPWEEGVPLLPETPEGVVAARRADLAAKNKIRRNQQISFRRFQQIAPGTTPLLDDMGWDAYLALRRRFPQGYGDVTGHDPRAGVTREIGLDTAAAEHGYDNPRDYLEALEREFQLVQAWRAEGAPDAGHLATEGDEAAWNRAENGRALDHARHQYDDATGPQPPPVPPEELDAARAEFDAADEDAYIAELEREPLPDAPVPPVPPVPSVPPADSEPPRLTPEQMAEADAAAKSKSDRIAKNLVGSTETSAWGDLSKSVPIVGDGTPRFVFKKGSSYSSVRKELYPIAQRNVEAQPNHITLPGGIPGMRIDGVDYSLPKDGLFHSFGGRADKNSPAVAQIGDVMNASVIVPGIAGDNTFRIAPVDFGEPGFAVLVFDKANKLTDFRLHSINVRTGTAARRVSAPAGSRPTAVTLSQVMRSWQEDFLPELSRRASEKMLAALRDSFPMDAKERKAFHAENRGLAVGANLGGRIVFLGEDARRVGKVLGLEVKGKANSKTDNAVLHFPAEDLIGNLQRLVNAGQRVALFNDGADMADKAQQQGLVEARRAELQARRAELRAKYQALLDVPQTAANASAFN